MISLHEPLDMLRNTICFNQKLYRESPLGEEICKRARICDEIFELYIKEEFPDLLKSVSVYFRQLNKLINSIEDEKVKEICLKYLKEAKGEFKNVNFAVGKSILKKCS